MTKPTPGGLLGAATLGAGISLAELPTAVPYFAALAAIISSSSALVYQFELVALFNVAFVLPLLVIIAVRAIAGGRSAKLLGHTRRALERYIGIALPCIVAFIAVVLLAVGVVGLAGG